MKKKQRQELTSKTIDQLKTVFQQLRNEITHHVVEQHAGKTKNASVIRDKKQTIARILTSIRIKELQQV